MNEDKSDELTNTIEEDGTLQGKVSEFSSKNEKREVKVLSDNYWYLLEDAYDGLFVTMVQDFKRM